MSADPYYRARYLPGAIKRAERKLAELYAEDAGKSRAIILKDLGFLHRAWEREIMEAQERMRKKGKDWTLGVDHAR